MDNNAKIITYFVGFYIIIGCIIYTSHSPILLIFKTLQTDHHIIHLNKKTHPSKTHPTDPVKSKLRSSFYRLDTQVFSGSCGSDFLELRIHPVDLPSRLPLLVGGFTLAIGAFVP